MRRKNVFAKEDVRQTRKKKNKTKRNFLCKTFFKTQVHSAEVVIE